MLACRFKERKFPEMRTKRLVALLMALVVVVGLLTMTASAVSQYKTCYCTAEAVFNGYTYSVNGQCRGVCPRCSATTYSATKQAEYVCPSNHRTYVTQSGTYYRCSTHGIV